MWTKSKNQPESRFKQIQNQESAPNQPESRFKQIQNQESESTSLFWNIDSTLLEYIFSSESCGESNCIELGFGDGEMVFSWKLGESQSNIRYSFQTAYQLVNQSKGLPLSVW